MRIIYLGTPEMVLKTLNAINNSYHKVVAVVTHKDKPHGRKRDLLVETPVAELAKELSIPVFKTDKLEPEMVQELKNLNADLFVVFAFGVIFKEDFLNCTRLGGINIHPSMLPKYRGPSPIQKAILDGVRESGITIQTVKLKIDSGNIILQEKFFIDDEDDIISVENKVSEHSSKMILEALKIIENNNSLDFPMQDEGLVSHCRLIKKENGLIDWSESATLIHNKVRAFIRWPIAYSFIENRKINIYKSSVLLDNPFSVNIKPGSLKLSSRRNGIIVKCGDGILSLKELQIEGKKRLDWREFLNGYLNINEKSFDSIEN